MKRLKIKRSSPIKTNDNTLAIGLYEKLNFRRMPLFAIKRKNAINEKFFAIPHQSYDALNPYARLIVDDAGSPLPASAIL